MLETLLTLLRQSIPDEIADLVFARINQLEAGEFEEILASSESRLLIGHEDTTHTKDVELQNFPAWSDYIFHRLGILLSDRSKAAGQYVYFCIGYAALLTLLQSNVTGPPLTFSSSDLLLPEDTKREPSRISSLRQQLLTSLGMDGIAAYRLTPNIELLCLADAIMTCPPILKNVPVARWAKMRIAFLQQRLLSEPSSTLQNVIYDDLDLLEQQFSEGTIGANARVEFLLERATIHTYHGLDKLARADLEQAKQLRSFEFALTGLLGKRTKYQEKDVSQLVVLARSAASDGEPPLDNDGRPAGSDKAALNDAAVQPRNLDLNDDTLLESISFSEKPKTLADIQDAQTLPTSLTSLEPSDQPQLDPLDSVILLTLASSITNTSPSDGLTREETLPYATRVLEGGSSNWQVYTQALLVRSRIEGFKSRTIERGLLQLQALVDQVIADTTGSDTEAQPDGDKAASSFLPKPKDLENAPVTERLRYIFTLASPTRWDLEAELAARWVQLGGLRSALDIYERLDMWAEAALCWAATEREDKAKTIVRRQLYHTTAAKPDVEADDEESWGGAERTPPPADAPRLYCILGDIDQSPTMYEKAWEVSNERYARAQRSLGRLYISSKDYVKAAEAYSKSLKVNQLNHSSWFALGCALLELSEFEKAIEAFSRCVQLDDQDAEAWSNLAAALLKSPPRLPTNGSATAEVNLDDEEAEPSAAKESSKPVQQNRQDALRALKRAAALKYDSHRIWENLLIVAASLSPLEYTTILSAQKRIVELRGPAIGEKAIDYEILELLVRHVMISAESYDPSQPGLPRMVVQFVDETVVPLITASAELWQLVSKLALWRNKPSGALEAEEKAWRAITTQPGWETETETRWDEVVEATVRLSDAYESLGPRERTEGMGTGEPVARDWNFKACSAIRGIMGRGKDSWDGTSGWERLKDTLDGLRA